MGHEIRHCIYDLNVDKNRVYSDWSERADREGGGLYNPIRWIDHICSSREEAEKFIEEHDKNWYDQLAVKFKQYPPTLTSSKKQKLNERFNEWNKKLYDLCNKVHYKDVKSKFISCPNCESKLNREFIKSNNCPLCYKDMRPKTILDTITRYKEIVEEIKMQIKEEDLKLQEKNEKLAVIKWLVKIEYHI